jgi:peptide subunit release factor 1 (eRF1)
VEDRIVVDAVPWVREMVAVLDEYHRCCVVMVDSKTARVWELYQDELREVGQLEDESLRKSDFAGWQGFSEHGVRNKADELARRHFRRVATLVDKLFRRERLELLAIGGHEHEVPRFIEALPRALRTRVAGTFAVDPHTVTAKTIRDHAGAIVERWERDEERGWVERVLEAEAAGGLAAVGVDDCLWASSVSAIEALLVQDDAVVPGVVCDESRWLAREGASCPLCGKPPRPTADVMDELVQFVIEDGGSIEHVYADTALAQHALAASLRFPLPAPPQ